MEGIHALFVERRQVGADSAEGIEAAGGAEASGDFLFDLGHPHRLLTEVVGEGDPAIGHKAPDIVGIGVQAVDEIERLTLLGPPAFARGRCARIGCGPGGEDLVMGHAIVGDALDTQWRTRRLDLMTGGAQQIDQALGPGLPPRLEDLGQFAPVVGMALAVRAGELTIRPPAVVDQGPGKCDQRAKGVECLLAAVGIGIEPRGYPAQNMLIT
jgi:hypothetical protein